MANTIRIKRSTSTAAPTTLANAELAYSEQSSKLFYGVGTGGAGGTATSIVAIGGPGAYTTLDTAQTISGNKTFSGTVALGSATVTGLSSSSVSEGTNLYYTDARARSAISVNTATGLSYNSTTGVVALASIPNSALANSTITINGVATPLGGSTTTTSVTNSLGSTVTFQGTAGEIEVSTNSGTSTFTFGLPDNPQITGNLSVGGNAVITGNLTVNGTTTTLSSTEVVVADKNIVLANVTTPTDVTADGAGLTIKGTSDKTFNWVDATDAFTSSEHINLASTKEFRINGTRVLNTDSLGFGVLYSSLTSVGTLTSGSLGAGFTTVAVARGGTGATTLTGYVKGNGTSAFTASATIPNTDISGLGTMSTQAASNVAITGGSITNLTTFDGVTLDGGTF